MGLLRVVVSCEGGEGIGGRGGAVSSCRGPPESVLTASLNHAVGPDAAAAVVAVATIVVGASAAASIVEATFDVADDVVVAPAVNAATATVVSVVAFFAATPP